MAETSTLSATEQPVAPPDRTGAIDEVRAVAGRLTRAMETVIEGKRLRGRDKIVAKRHAITSRALADCNR